MESVSTATSVYTYFGDFAVGSLFTRYAIALLAVESSGRSGIFVHSGNTTTDIDLTVVELGAQMPGRNETFKYLADPSILVLPTEIRVAFMAKGDTDYRAVYLATSKLGKPFELEVVVDETTAIPHDEGYFFKCFYGPQVTVYSVVFFGSHCGTKSSTQKVDNDGYGPVQAQSMRRLVVGSTTATDHVLRVEHLNAGIYNINLINKEVSSLASMPAKTLVPGKGNQTFVSFSSPVVSGGFVAFAGLASGGSVGLYRFNLFANSLTKVADTSDSVPGANVPFSDFPRGCSVGSDGAVAFYAVAPDDNTGVFAQDEFQSGTSKLFDMNNTVSGYTLDYIGFGAEGYTAYGESIVAYLVLLNSSSPIVGVWELNNVHGPRMLV